VLLAPALTQPLIGIGLVAAVVGAWLAWKSVAYPLALSGVPTLIDAVFGKNPLPKGGVTFIFGAWIALAIAFAIMRREHQIATRAFWSLPVAMAFLLLGLLVFRLSNSPDPSFGGTKLQLYVADNLVYMAGALFVGSDRKSLRLFLNITLALAAAGGLFLLFQLATGNAHQQYSGRFAISAQEGPIYLGRESATGILIAIAMVLAATKVATRLWAIAVLPALFVALIGAGSRGPTVAFVFGFVALLALTAAGGRARRRLAVVVVALLVAAIAVPLIVPGSAIGRSLSTIVGSASGLSSNGRSSLWAQAYGLFAQHPFFGIGTGGFAAQTPELYPHNILLEAGVELGILGLLAVAAMMWSMAARMAAVWRWSSGGARLDAALLIALFVSAVVNAFFSGAIQDNLPIWVWGGLGLGLYAASGLTRTSRAREQRRRPRWRLAGVT
jgi:O-antigen ligase